MKITKLYTGEDNESHFCEIDTGPVTTQELGNYSKPFPATSVMFREFEEGKVFDWHNAPQPQYIIYLEGEVEIEIGCGEKKIFKQGEILFAADLTGRGHISKTIKKGKPLIITTQ